MAKIEVIEQLKNFYSKLTKLQKGLIFGVLIAVLAGTILLLSSASPEKEMGVLYSNLEDSDASKILEILKEKNIKYELKENGKTILVDKNQVYETRLQIAGEGLPESSTVGYEIFDKTNLGMSEFVQKLNYRRALEGELSKTINSLDEVKNARVHIVIPEKALFEKDQKEPTASVFLNLKSGRSISKVSIEGIQNLVASSIEGMKPDAVTVVDKQGKILSPSPLNENSIAGLTASQLEQQVKAEQYIANKVQSLLNNVLGEGNAQVRVNAELDFTQVEKEITDFDPDRQVLRSEQTISEVSNSSDSLSYPAVNMARDQSNVISNYEISKTISRVREEVGNIKRLSVAAIVNGVTKVVEKDGQKAIEYIPRKEEEMQKLTDIVKNAVGYDPTRNDQVTVLNVPFDMTWLEEEVKDTIQPVWWQNPEYIKLIVLVVAMILTILLMYKLLQSKQIRERIRIAFSLPEKAEVEDDIAEEREEELEELEFDEDELLLLPAELPEQLLLEGDRIEKESEGFDDGGDEDGLDKNALAARARAKLDDSGATSLSEEALMSLELKSKVQNYVQSQPSEAAKLVRIFISQDLNLKGFNF